MGNQCCAAKESTTEETVTRGPVGLASAPPEIEVPPNYKIDEVRFDEPGLRVKVEAHLARGQPILCPCPSPGPYAVIAADPSTVNKAKGRSDKQAVARMVGSLAEVTDIIDMDDEGLAVAKQHVEVERMTCLLPLHVSVTNQDVNVLDDIDDTGKRVSNKDGQGSIVDSRSRASCVFKQFAIFYQHHVPDLDELCSKIGPLFCSSGNAHSNPMGQSFREVVNQFKAVRPEEPMHLLAIDGDFLRDAPKHESTSMIRIDSNGTYRFTREGYHHFPELKDSKNWRLTEEDFMKWRMR